MNKITALLAIMALPVILSQCGSITVTDTASARDTVSTRRDSTDKRDTVTYRDTISCGDTWIFTKQLDSTAYDTISRGWKLQIKKPVSKYSLYRDVKISRDTTIGSGTYTTTVDLAGYPHRWTDSTLSILDSSRTLNGATCKVFMYEICETISGLFR